MSEHFLLQNSIQHERKSLFESYFCSTKVVDYGTALFQRIERRGACGNSERLRDFTTYAEPASLGDACVNVRWWSAGTRQLFEGEKLSKYKINVSQHLWTR